jgi:hypothetical protein
LQTCRRVHDVSRRHPLALARPGGEDDESFAGVDADAEIESQSGVRGVHLGDRVADRECSTNGALRIVLMREWRSEQSHDRVADELLDGPAEALELCPQPQVIRREHRADVLGVHLLGAGREPDEVGEQHGNDLSLFFGLRLPRSERRPAGEAEPRRLRVLLAAALAVLYRHDRKRSERTEVDLRPRRS